MTRLRAICTAVALVCASGQVFADTAIHNASAEAFLTLAHADKLGTPVYMQVQQMFAQRFEQTKAPAAKQSVLDSYQAKANAALDQAIGWPKLKPDMVSSTPPTSANPSSRTWLLSTSRHWARKSWKKCRN